MNKRIKNLFLIGLIVGFSTVTGLAQGQWGSGWPPLPQTNALPQLALSDAYNLVLTHLGGATNHFHCVGASLIEMTNYPFHAWSFSFVDTNAQQVSVQATFDKQVQMDSRSNQILSSCVIVYADCIAMLRAISGATWMWVFDHQKTKEDVPTDAELFGLDRYILKKPQCPQGGQFTLETVEKMPRCSIPGHTL